MVVQPAVYFVVKPFGIHKFPEGSVRNTVYTGYQSVICQLCFIRLDAVIDAAQHAAGGLSSGFYEVYDCHYCHRFRFRMSESNSLTVA